MLCTLTLIFFLLADIYGRLKTGLVVSVFIDILFLNLISPKGVVWDFCRNELVHLNKIFVVVIPGSLPIGESALIQDFLLYLSGVVRVVFDFVPEPFEICNRHLRAGLLI